LQHYVSGRSAPWGILYDHSCPHFWLALSSLCYYLDTAALAAISRLIQMPWKSQPSTAKPFQVQR
jgi:hypothetical protein